MAWTPGSGPPPDGNANDAASTNERQERSASVTGLHRFGPVEARGKRHPFSKVVLPPASDVRPRAEMGVPLSVMKKPKTTSIPEKWDEPDENAARGSGDSVSYLGRLTRQRLLTYEEEVALAARVQRGDARAKERLIEANMRLVINIAKNYHNCLVPFEDLVQEGAIGLMTAAERFDPTKGYRFSTYATHWIRQSISRALDNKSKAIRIPAHVSENLRKVDRTRALLFREQGEEPTTEQIAQRMGIST